MRSPDKPRHSRLARLTALAVAALTAMATLAGCVHKTPPLDPDTTTWFPLPTLPTGASTWYPPGWTSTTPTPTALPTATSDPLYQEAVQVYQTYYDAYNEAQVGGGTDTLPPVLDAILADSAREGTALLLANQKRSGIHYEGTPTFRLAWMRPYTHETPSGALVGVETCEESTIVIVDAGGNELDTSGHAWFSHQAFFKRNADRKLVMFWFLGGKVASCPA